MNNQCLISLALVMAMSSWSVVAGTLINSTDNVGNNVSVLIDNKMARVDSSDLEGYMVINMATQKLYVVSHDEHVVIDLSSTTDNNSRPDSTFARKVERPATTFVDQGSGPEIAGYATRHYKVMVGDKRCFDEFLSKKLISFPEVHKFIEVMAKQSQARENEGMVEYFTADNPCESAEDVMDQKHLSLGLPLRTLDDQGVVIYEVTRIALDAESSADTFSFPKDYPLVSKNEMMQRMIEQIRPLNEEGMHENLHEHLDESVPNSDTKKRD